MMVMMKSGTSPREDGWKENVSFFGFFLKREVIFRLILT